MAAKLKGKIALVTGAAQGIGAAIAQAFVAEGAFVYITDLNAGLGHAVAAELGDLACSLPLDVRLEADW